MSDNRNNQLASSQTPAKLPEIDHFTKTPQAKAVFRAHLLAKTKRKNNNMAGKNQFSFEKNITPYSLKYSLASSLLSEGKSINYICTYTGLCKETVSKIKKGEIKLLNKWADEIKSHETGKMTFLSNSILDSVNQGDLNKASLLQKVTSASILIDKRRLLDGESTENINHLAKLDVLFSKRDEAKNVLGKLKSVDNK